MSSDYSIPVWISGYKSSRGFLTKSFTTWDLIKVLASAAVVLALLIFIIFAWYRKILCFKKYRSSNRTRDSNTGNLEPVTVSNNGRQMVRTQNLHPGGYPGVEPGIRSYYQDDLPPSYQQATQFNNPTFDP